jgi:single-strand DNA-binding protein
MPAYNKIILVGNLTRDPELRYLPNQTSVVDIGLAVNHRWKTAQGEDREEVCFIDCTAFGKSAETINKYCQKGKPLLVEGRLRYESWEDKQSGQKRSKHKVVIDGFQFLGSRSDADDEQPPPSTNHPKNRQAVQQGASPSPISEEQHFKADDIPF